MFNFSYNNFFQKEIKKINYLSNKEELEYLIFIALDNKGNLVLSDKYTGASRESVGREAMLKAKKNIQKKLNKIGGGILLSSLHSHLKGDTGKGPNAVDALTIKRDNDISVGMVVRLNLVYFYDETEWYYQVSMPGLEYGVYFDQRKIIEIPAKVGSLYGAVEHWRVDYMFASKKSPLIFIL